MLEASTEKGENATKFGLAIRCKFNKSELFIKWNSYLGDEVLIASRFSFHQEEKTLKWRLSDDSTAAFYPGNPVSFIKSMLDETRYIVKVTPDSGSPLLAIFDISGIYEATKTLRKNCGL